MTMLSINRYGRCAARGFNGAAKIEAQAVAEINNLTTGNKHAVHLGIFK